MIEERLREALAEAAQEVRVEASDIPTIRSARRRVTFSAISIAGLLIVIAAAAVVGLDWTTHRQLSSGQVVSPSLTGESEQALERRATRLRQALRDLRSQVADLDADLRDIDGRAHRSDAIRVALRGRRARVQGEIAEIEAQLASLLRRIESNDSR